MKALRNKSPILFLFTELLVPIAFGQSVAVSQLTCNPASLSSGVSTSCTVTLSGAAPTGGLLVLLSSNNTILSIPTSSVTVPGGATSTTFKATAGAITTNQSVTLSATALNSVSLSWSASTSPNLTNYNVYRGVTSGGPYSLLTTLGLTTSYTDYNIQNGQNYYYVTTALNNTGAESAYSNQALAAVPSGVTQSTTISLVASPPALSSFACNPTSLSTGAATVCTVGLTSVAPNGGTAVALSSNSSLLPVPTASVTVPAGSLSANFTATAGTIPSSQTATLTATLSGVSKTASISLIAASAIGFVQAAAATPQSNTATVSVSYTGAQTAGDLNIVVVGWNDTTATVQSVTDSAGNTYRLAIGPTSGTALRQSIYYASNITGGSDTITVTFSQAAAYPDIRILEYRGVSTVDVTAGSSGNSAKSSSGFATTTGANELIFAANTVATMTGTAGSGFTSRVITYPDGDIAEDSVVTTAGTYGASAPLTSSGPWVMQMVALK